MNTVKYYLSELLRMFNDAPISLKISFMAAFGLVLFLAWFFIVMIISFPSIGVFLLLLIVAMKSLIHILYHMRPPHD